MANFGDDEPRASANPRMDSSSSEPLEPRISFPGVVRYSIRDTPLSAISWLVPLPPPTVSLFPQPTGQIESSCPNGLKRFLRYRSTARRGTFEDLHHSCCSSLSENSFEDTRTFSQSTEPNDIILNLSTVDERMEAQGEQVSAERRYQLLDLIIMVVRLLPFVLITHLTWTGILLGVSAFRS